MGKCTNSDYPKVSVSIPCYNATTTPQKEQWLRRSIESVLAQTFENFELLLVNDGSTDTTANVIKDYTNDHRVRYIQQENQGYAGARNTGLEAGEGEYYAFIGQDDVWLPNKLERQLEYIQKEEATIVHTNAYHIDDYGKRTTIHHKNSPPKQTDSKEFIKTLFLGNFICIQSVVAHRSVFDTRRFDEKFQINCDHDMWMRAASEHNFEYFDEKLIEKRFHGENTSSNYKRMFKERRMIADKMADYYPFIGSLKSKKLSDAYLFYGIDLLKHGQPRKARRRIRKAIRLNRTNLEGYPVYLLSFGGNTIGKKIIKALSS